MRAAVRTRFGPPEVVRVQDVPAPVPGRGQLLVRVHATTVNRTDCGFRSGQPLVARPFYGLSRPRVQVLGCEFAGEVAEIGHGTTAFRTGDRVFGYDDSAFGGHAEYLVVPEDAMVALVPDGMSCEQVAPATEGSHYAFNLLTSAGVTRGDQVLVNGSTGAIGSAAVQLAARLGSRVTAVCRPEHGELVTRLGAARVIDYTTHDFTDDDDRYDVVLDAVGTSTFGRVRRLLKPRGTYLSTELGPWGQNPVLGLLTPPLGRRKVRFPIPRTNPRVARLLQGLLQTGEFLPVIDRTYPLESIVEAYRYVDSGQKVGSVVIRVAP